MFKTQLQSDTNFFNSQRGLLEQDETNILPTAKVQAWVPSLAPIQVLKEGRYKKHDKKYC